jgi:NAD(P)-dependent dehydrogenase (short-subunit alcohol dehydrogenase family)
MIGFPKSVTRHARAVVTGAGSGIGRAFAMELAERGAQVVCADIDDGSAQETVDLVEQKGGRGSGIAIACDVASSAEVLELRDRAITWFGAAPTLLVNNAGIGAGGANVGHFSLADWERTLGINLWGAVYGCHHFLPTMKAAGHGGIVNVASAAGFAAGPRMAAYNVSKAGVMSLSETLAAELSGSGVRVTVLCPTFVKTNIFAGELIEPGAALAAAKIAKYVGMSPEKVAAMTLDAHDKGRLYVVPQVDARAIWLAKRLAPTTHVRIGGLLGRVARFAPEEGTSP